MPFIVKKIISNQPYYYLRTSKRVGNKIKAITLAYLGKDKTDSEKKAAIITSQLKKSKNLKPLVSKETIMKENKENKTKGETKDF